jgi:hypothetical protein
MRIFDASLVRSALSAVASVGFVAGCGGSQPPIGAADMRQPSIQRATSSGSALLYVMMGPSGTYMLTYPGFKQVKRIRVSGLSTSNPNNGEVLIGGINGTLNLYAHGGTNPIHVFDLSSDVFPYDGAFDPTSDAIAITGNMAESRSGHVYVYRTSTSYPIVYTVPKIPYLRFIGYDATGDLFVDGFNSKKDYLLAELPKGGTAFVDLTIGGAIRSMHSIQWDGNYITVFDRASIYRLQISGSTATIVGQTKLTGSRVGSGEFWIQGDTVIGPHVSDRPRNGRWVGFWHYPTGGRAYVLIKNLSKGQKEARVTSATVSVAPSR